MEFGTFLGNEALRSALSQAQQAGKLAHSYLLCGPAGAGKHSLALQLSAALQCRSPQGAPCGRCAACRKVFAGTHPDVIFCVDEKHKQFGVDRARWVCGDAYVRPNEGQRKLYIFPQELNLAAQNALLKVIEEPPAYAVFLLLSANPQGLLPTLRSRCQELRLAPLSREILESALRSRCPGRSAGEYQAAIALSGGWLGQALQALEQSGLDSRTERFAQAFAKGDRLALLELLVSMEKLKREEFCEALGNWRVLLHQALRCQAGLKGGEAAVALARSHSPAELMGLVEALQEAMDRAQGNVGVGHLCGALRESLLK